MDKPIYKRAAFWIAVFSVLALALILVFTLTGKKQNDPRESVVSSDKEWKKFISENGYSELIREPLESTERYDLSNAKWEYSLFDLDGDGNDEMMIRLDVASGESARLFLFCSDGKDVSLAGDYEGIEYPIFFPSENVFEAPSNGGEHTFYKLEGLNGVLAFTLKEKQNMYYRDDEEITREEYSDYFDDGVFLDWTTFRSEFVYSSTPISDSSFPYYIKFKEIEPVSNVPDEFKEIVNENLFSGATWSGGALLKTDYSGDDGSITVTKYDVYGKAVDIFEIHSEPHFAAGGFCFTSDGGLIYFDRFDVKEAEEIDKNDAESFVVKLDADGSREWATSVDDIYVDYSIYDEIIIEKDGCFYLIVTDGESEATDSEVYYYAKDALVYKLDKDGGVIGRRTVGGSDMDWAEAAYVDGEGNLALYCFTKSHDGDFADNRILTYGIKCYEIKLNDDLETVSTERVSISASFFLIGQIDGKKIYSWDKFAEDFPDGELTLVVDYGDFYLTVSEYMPFSYLNSSAAYNVVETVYGAYDKDGAVLWKGIYEPPNSRSTGEISQSIIFY